MLVVEDEPVLREMAQMILEEFGYRVILATNGKEALEMWERHQNSIDLLFTDMVMPAGLSGMELAHKLIAQRKELRVVFASGYTVDDISTDFLTRNNDARFLQKPYTRINLARAVREALDGDAKHRTTSPFMATATA
ncbi:MAG: response regulator [Verrucomicrobiota bacterium]